MNALQWKPSYTGDPRFPAFELPAKSKQSAPQADTKAEPSPQLEPYGHEAWSAASQVDDTLTTKAVAEFCGTSVHTVHAWRRNGKLPSFPLIAQLYYYKRTDLEAALRKAINLGYASDSKPAPRRRSRTTSKKEKTQ